MQSPMKITALNKSPLFHDILGQFGMYVTFIGVYTCTDVGRCDIPQGQSCMHAHTWNDIMYRIYIPDRHTQY